MHLELLGNNIYWFSWREKNKLVLKRKQKIKKFKILVLYWALGIFSSFDGICGLPASYPSSFFLTKRNLGWCAQLKSYVFLISFAGKQSKYKSNVLCWGILFCDLDGWGSCLEHWRSHAKDAGVERWKEPRFQMIRWNCHVSPELCISRLQLQWVTAISRI